MLPQDQIRLITCLVSSVILSYFIGKLKCPKKFTALSIAITIVFQLYVFRQEAFFLWVQQAIVFCLCRWTSRKNIGKTVLIQTFVYLIAVQMRRMWVAYGRNDVDITAVLMMQVFLYVGFAFNYQDGADKNNNSPRKICEFPPLKEFVGYLFFLPASMVGPVFQFKDYQNYLHRQQNYKTLPDDTWPGIYLELKTFVISIVVYISLLSFDLDYMLNEEYGAQNILYKIVYMMIAIIAFRFKYYSAWSLGMLGMNATGITYSAHTTENKDVISANWNRIEVSDIWAFQFDQSMKVKSEAWNKTVQLALRRYIYERIYDPKQEDSDKIKKKKQLKSQQTTLFVSAIWHGLYPGYFVSFFHWALLLQISQQLFRVQRNSPKFAEMRKKLKYVQLIVVNFFLGYFGVCFVLMSFDRIWTFFSMMYFIPPVIIYIGNILIVRMGLLNKKRPTKVENFDNSPNPQFEKVPVRNTKKQN